MNKLFEKNSRYRFAVLGFFVGLVLLILPIPFKKEVEILPETGEEDQLVIELTVDKQDVQRDDPTGGAQLVTYSIVVRNQAECTPTSNDVSLVYDKSGSMLGLMNGAKQAGITFIGNLDLTKDQASIVAYDDNAYLLQQLTNSESSLAAAINSISAGGMTNIGEGILVAKEELLSSRHIPESNQVMLIFTDGRANRPGNTTYAQQYAIEQAKSAKDAGIRIIAIAYGAYADEDLMRQIASPGSGNYFYAPTAADMVNIYAAISENLQGDSPDTNVSIDLTQFQDILDLESISAGGNLSQGQLSWNLGTLQCQETAYLEFSVNVNSNASDLDIIDIIANVANSAGENAISENATTNVHAPRFNISKTDHKDEAMPQDTLDYAISVINEGTGNAYGVKITDLLPPEYFNLDINSISGNGFTQENTIIWDNEGPGFVLDGSFEPTGSSWGNSLGFSFSGNVNGITDPGVYSLLNTVRLTTENGYTQEATDVTAVPYAPDLSITKLSNPTLYTYPDGLVAYSLIIKNNGNIDATEVTVTDDYDETYLSVSPEGGFVQNGTIVWSVGNLAVGEEKTLTYTARVNATIPENTVTIPNEARITSAEPDIDESDNLALNEIIATLDPVLMITKESDKITYLKSEEITYTITITNNSNADAYNLALEDTIPTELIYIQGSTILAGSTYEDPSGSNVLSWNFAHLYRGESLVLSFRVRADENCAQGNYPNTAEIAWEDEESNSFGPQADSVTISIVEAQGEADISPDIETSESLVSSILGSIRVLGENLVRTGEAVIYLKLILGLVLALPFPLMLIFERKNRKKTKKPKKKRKK